MKKYLFKKIISLGLVVAMTVSSGQYEIKRNLSNFSEKISKGLKLPKRKLFFK